MLKWNELLKDFGKYLLSNIALYPKLELMFVMVIVPLIMNSIQVIYYIFNIYYIILYFYYIYLYFSFGLLIIY
jgi:hypothetical protein